MGAGRRMKRKQGCPPPLERDSYTAKSKKWKGSISNENLLSDDGDDKLESLKDIGESPGMLKSKNRILKSHLKQEMPDSVKLFKRPILKKKAVKREKVFLPESCANEDTSDNSNISENSFSYQSDNEDDEFVGFSCSSGVELSDDEDLTSSQEKNNFWSDDDNAFSGDDEELLNASNIEGLSLKLEAEQAKRNEEADIELQRSIQRSKQDNLEDISLSDDDENDGNDVTQSVKPAPDLTLIRQRIADTVRILENFTTIDTVHRNRSYYTSRILKDICDYYGYTLFLAEKLYQLFSPREAIAFFEASETPRPVVIRVNSLRTSRRNLAQSLTNRGVSLEPVGKWSNVGLQIFNSPVPIGATPEYLNGQYMPQAAVSFIPVIALDPQEHERILDMTAAPGGKTTYAAALMQNTGCIFANDSNKKRLKALIGNIHRMGVRNTIVCNYDGTEFPKVMGGFDRVLLDAPCSGTGVISKDPNIKSSKTELDFMKLPHIQKQLLLAAIDSTNHSAKNGGYVVYSTCSVTVEENEQVVQYALSRRPNVRIIDMENVTIGKEAFTSYRGKTFDKSMSKARRFYPHALNMDGFFVCKLKKFAPTKVPSAAPHPST